MTHENRHPTRGRPPKPLLSRAMILREALALVDAEGAEGLTMAQLGLRLGVRAASLYHHVPDKATIWEGIRDLVTAEMDWSAFDEKPWDTALEAWAHSYRAAFLKHPNTVMDLFSRPVATDLTYAMYEAVATSLHEAGWPLEQLVPVISAVEYLICGSVVDHEALGDMFAQARDRGAPLVAAAMRSQLSQADSADQGFEVALVGLVGGLRAQLEHLPDRPIHRAPPTGR